MDTLRNFDMVPTKPLYLLVCFSAITCLFSIVSQNFPLQFAESLEFMFPMVLQTSLFCLLLASQYQPDTFLLEKPTKLEFFHLTNDILFNKEFLKLKNYFHHSNHTYDHVVRVAYISYSIAKTLGLDYRATARGGLLHDFFLYDWRERKASDLRRNMHGKEHPLIALANARKNFSVNDLEADIIVKHMFPKTHALPRHSESFVVCFSDKIAASYEYLSHLSHPKTHTISR